MRVAFHSPLPPERSGIADYSYELLEELRHHLEIVAVVRDDLVGVDRAPEGVEVVGSSAIRPGDVDCDIYQMGNNPRYHRFLYQRALDEPGLLVLHDPSLADFHAEMCGTADSGVFRAEVVYDDPTRRFGDELPLVEVGRNGRDLDRLEVLLARRLVTSSIRTLVHSSAVASALRDRYEGCDVATIQLPAQVLDRPRLGTRASDEVVFGVFGGINYYKRIDAVVAAFRQLCHEQVPARLVIAGRPDDRVMTAELLRLAASEELAGRLEVKTELSLAELEAEMAACDVAVSLRWPTAGEMSATLMRAFGAGRPAVVTDVLQFRELDERFCWRVPMGEEEVPRLVEILRAAASDKERLAEAGELARGFVEREATYQVVSEQYVGHVEHCARRRAAGKAAVLPLGLGANAVLGVNLVGAEPPGSDGADMVAALAEALRAAGVDVVEAPLETSSAEPAALERLLPERTVQAGKARRAVEKAARRTRRYHEAHGRPPTEPSPPSKAAPAAFSLRGRARSTRVAVEDLHEIDLCRADARRAVLLGDRLRAGHRRGRRTVAVVEADAWPMARAFRRLIRHADEIWAPSSFSADLLAGATTAPVLVVPPCLPPSWWEPVPQAGTSPGGQPGPLRVLAVADASKGLASANLEGAIDAFARAFGACGPRAELEVVVRHLAGRQEARRRLTAALEALGGRLVEEDDGDELAARVGGCDVLVSLHRTQSFGLWCARAMTASKVVVATAYGGCLDYLSPDSGCLVGYDLEPRSEGDFYLDAPGEWGVEVGQRWARPDLDQAAAWLVRLADHESLRRRLGAGARRSIEAQCEPVAVGSRLRAQLAALEHRSPRDLERARRQATKARLAGKPVTGAASVPGEHR